MLINMITDTKIRQRAMALTTTDTITDFSSILRSTVAYPQERLTPQLRRWKKRKEGGEADHGDLTLLVLSVSASYV